MKIINKNYKINSKLNKKICLISDIHYLNSKDIKRLNLILDNIKNLNPDYICIPGDIIDKSKIEDEGLFIDWLKKLSKITKVIISIGNHEFYINKPKKIFSLNYDFFEKISKIKNVYLLDNKSLIVDNINFIGITLPIEFYFKRKSSISSLLKKIKIEKNCYNVLLCHSPINICREKKLKNIDLVLCGHMHGGVVPSFLRFIFRNRGIISPTKRLFPKYAYGNIKKNNTNIIITSGTKVLSTNNFFNPEVVIISLINKSTKL